MLNDSEMAEGKLMEHGSRGHEKLRSRAQVGALTLNQSNDILPNKNGKDGMVADKHRYVVWGKKYILPGIKL